MPPLLLSVDKGISSKLWACVRNLRERTLIPIILPQILRSVMLCATPFAAKFLIVEQLLHGMSWPIAPVHGCNIWDAQGLSWADSQWNCNPTLTVNNMNICSDFFLVVGGSKAWFIDARHTDDSTNPAYSLACDYALALSRFQADEGLFLTSNTVLSLNRNSHKPRIWQITTGSYYDRFIGHVCSKHLLCE